jgi:hypothetical protein
MLCQAVGIPEGELQEFSNYLSLVSTVVRRFSIVPISSKRLFIIFLSPVYRWFAEDVSLCVDIALYLWQHKNFDWLFAHMLYERFSIKIISENSLKAINECNKTVSSELLCVAGLCN